MTSKLIRLSAWFSSILALAMTATSQAQAPVPGTTIHRQAVAEPLRDGWVQGASTGGRYSLEIPCAYNDVTATPETRPSAGNDLAFVVACDRGDGVRFYAMRMQYPGGRAAAESKFAERFSGLPIAANARISEGRTAGRAYVDLDLDQPGQCLYARLLRTGDDNLLMLVEPVNAPNARCGDLATDAGRFRRSITVPE